MRNKLFLLIFLISCQVHKRDEQKPFTPLTISGDEEWITYEGKWLTKAGIIRFELSLKSGAFGYDSYYKLNESFDGDSSGSGKPSQGLYSSYDGSTKSEFRICLHDVGGYDNGGYLRFKTFNNKDEMFFMTRGNDELLPCDSKFNPLTLDRRYTLHRRSNLFTVEGYFTMNQDSIEFFERNTREYWKITDLGEFNEIGRAHV